MNNIWSITLCVFLGLAIVAVIIIDTSKESNNKLEEAIEPPKKEASIQRLEGLKYYKDENTNLCFAYVERVANTVALAGLTHVPCENLSALTLFRSKDISSDY